MNLLSIVSLILAAGCLALAAITVRVAWTTTFMTTWPSRLAQVTGVVVALIAGAWYALIGISPGIELDTPAILALAYLAIPFVMVAVLTLAMAAASSSPKRPR